MSADTVAVSDYGRQLIDTALKAIDAEMGASTRDQPADPASLVSIDGDGTVGVNATELTRQLEQRARSALRPELDRSVAAVKQTRKRWFSGAGVFALGLLIMAASGVDPGIIGLAYVALGFLGVYLVVVYWKSETKVERLQRDVTMKVASVAERAFEDCIEHLHQIEHSREPSRLAARVAIGSPPPEPQPFGVSHEGAEAIVAVWMRHLGEADAAVTRFVGDGGIDVAGSHYIAQVKNYAGAVGVAEVRELAGVAAVDGREPLFFTSGTYSDGARTFADQARVALFRYSATAGTLASANGLAKEGLARGLAAPEDFAQDS